MTQNVRGAGFSPYCAECPCAQKGKPSSPVPSFGGTGGLCIVGEGPGSEEIRQGMPFVGPSGKLVKRAFRQSGIDRSLVWICNALVCPRPESDEAMDYAVECCRERLRDDLELGQPTAICALGATAMRALQLPVHFVSQARGTVQESPLLPGIPVIGALHPAALLHGGAGEMLGGKQKMNVDAQALFLFSDVAKAYRVSTGELPAKWSDDILVVHDPAEVQAALFGIIEDIYEWGLLGLDLEWTCEGSANALDALGADAHRARITWVGVGCEKRAVSFSWEALVESDQLAQLQAVMEDAELPKLMHNKQADIAVWEAQQVGPIRGRCLDSLLMHHCTYPGIDHELQQMASQFLCVPPWKVEHRREIAEHEAKMREEARAAKAVEKEARKAERVAEHERKNAEKAAAAAERKAERQAEHERRNAERAAERAARKAEKQAEHERKNAARAAEKEARKAAKRSGAPATLPRQLNLEGTE